MKPYIFFLLLITVVLLFFHLGARPLLSSGEARASQIAVEMLSRRNILIPYLNEEILLTKPVFFHWFIILSYKIFGISEFAARVPSAVSGVLVILLVYLLGKKFWGVKAGLISGLILATSPLFFWSVRCARIDAMLLLFIMLSLCCFWQGYQKLPYGKLWFLGWFFFMGLGFLCKGPVGIVVPFLTVVLFAVFAGKYSLLKKLNWIWGILVFLAVSLPWYISIYFLVPRYKSEYFFHRQNLIWLSGKDEWYKCFAYIPHLFAGFFPWSLFLPFAFVYTWRILKKHKDEKIIFLWE